MFGLPGSRDSSFHLPERCGHQGNCKPPPLQRITHNSPAGCFSLIKGILQCHPLWPSHSEDRQTPTHLFRFPSLIFGVLSVNKFWVFSGQQDEGISLRACSEKEMLSLIANPHDSTQLTNRLQDLRHCFFLRLTSL